MTDSRQHVRTVGISTTESSGHSVYCFPCGRAFSRTSALKRHRISLHQSGPILRCDVECCNMSFNRKDTLERHRNNQQGSSKVPCPRCGKPIRKDGLEEHQTTAICGSLVAVISCVQNPEDGRKIPNETQTEQRLASSVGSSEQSESSVTDHGHRNSALTTPAATPPAAGCLQPETPRHMPEIREEDNVQLVLSGDDVTYSEQRIRPAAGSQFCIKQETEAISLSDIFQIPTIVPDSPRPPFSVEIFDIIFYQEEYKWDSRALSSMAIGPLRFRRDLFPRPFSRPLSPDMPFGSSRSAMRGPSQIKSLIYRTVSLRWPFGSSVSKAPWHVSNPQQDLSKEQAKAPDATDCEDFPVRCASETSLSISSQCEGRSKPHTLSWPLPLDSALVSTCLLHRRALKKFNFKILRRRF